MLNEKKAYRLEERFGDGRVNETEFTELTAALAAFDARLTEVERSSNALGVFNPLDACVGARRLVLIGPDRPPAGQPMTAHRWGWRR